MNYQKIYDNLIKKRVENPPTEKFERRVKFDSGSAIHKYDKRTCIYCGEEFEACRRRKGNWCNNCKHHHFKLNPTLKVEGRDYLTDEQHIELFHEFLESGLNVRQFASQCRYNVSLWHLYERWKNLGLDYRRRNKQNK